MKTRWLVPVLVAVVFVSLAGVATARVDPVDVAPPPGAIDAEESALDAATIAWLKSLDVPPRAPDHVPGVKVERPDRLEQGYSFLIDDFEQEDVELDVFKGWLLVDDLNGGRSGEYYWGTSDCRSSAGNKAAWAVGDGVDGLALSCGDQYPADAKSSATLRLDLTGWEMDVDSLELVFDFWLNVRTEVEGGVVPDGLFISYMFPSQRGDEAVERIVGRAVTAKLPDRFWDVPIRIDLTEFREVYPPYRTFNLAGLEDVDIEFLFVTQQQDGERHQDGAFIDDVRIEASDGPDPDATARTPTPPEPPATWTPDEPRTPGTETETPETTEPPSETPETEEPPTETPTETAGTEEPPTDTPTVTPSATPTIEPATETPTPTEEPPGPEIYMPIGLNRAELGGPVPPQPTEPAGTDEPTEPAGTDEPTEPAGTEEPTEPAGTEEPMPTETPVPDVMVTLTEMDESGVMGDGMLWNVDPDVYVKLVLTGTMGTLAARIHEGAACDELGDLLYELEDVVDGMSETTLAETDLADLASGESAIAIFDDGEPAVLQSCGMIPAVAP